MENIEDIEDIDFRTINLSRDWFELGKNKRFPDSSSQANNIAIKFVAYWIAFNSAYAHMNPNYGEKDKIKFYIEDNKHFFEDLFDFENDKDIEIFKEFPILKCDKTPDPNYDYKNIVKRVNDNGKIEYEYPYFHDLTDNHSSYTKRVKALFLSIYQVRNNMFHGSKKPDDGRNYKLVASSVKILETILTKILYK